MAYPSHGLFPVKRRSAFRRQLSFHRMAGFRSFLFAVKPIAAEGGGLKGQALLRTRTTDDGAGPMKHPEFRPVRMTRPPKARSTSHTVAARAAAPKSRLRRVGSDERDHSLLRLFRPGISPVRSLDSSFGYSGTVSSSLHDRVLDNDARGDVFPQRHEQLASHGDDGRLLAAAAFDPLLEPQR